MSSTMTPHTADPVRSTHTAAELPVPNLSEWQQDQFDRHLRYARSLELSPDQALRFALRQIKTARPGRAVQAELGSTH